MAVARRGVHPGPLRRCCPSPPSRPPRRPPATPPARALGLPRRRRRAGRDGLAVQARARSTTSASPTWSSRCSTPLPDAVVLVVGPDDAGAWAEARARTGGRLRALGRLDDPSVVLAAADVFLDAYPCSSLTAALEAAALGVPVRQLPAAPPPGGDLRHRRARPRRRPRRRAHPRRVRRGARAASPPTPPPGPTSAPAPPPPRPRCTTAGRWARRPGGRLRHARAPTPPPAPSARRRPRHRAPTPTTRTPSCCRSTRRPASPSAPGARCCATATPSRATPRRGLSIVVHCRDDRRRPAARHRLGRRDLRRSRRGRGHRDRRRLRPRDRGRASTGSPATSRVVRNPTPLGPQAAFAGAIAVARGPGGAAHDQRRRAAPGWLDAPRGRPRPARRQRRRARSSCGGTGREVCVLTSVASARAGSAVIAQSVPDSVVQAAPAAPWRPSHDERLHDRRPQLPGAGVGAGGLLRRGVPRGRRSRSS